MLRVLCWFAGRFRKNMKIRAGAVPEHFFYPWKLWLKQQPAGIVDWEWMEFPGGSGDMIRALEENSVDVAFLLSESALQAISRGSGLEVLASFVESPLQWGIFTGAHNKIQSVEEGKTYAISRFSSGSHLMAVLEAYSRGHAIDSGEWKISGNLEGARKLLRSGEADLFFWEKWTTSPLVDSGEFRMLSVFPGPWPAFLFCAKAGFMNDSLTAKTVKKAFEEVCHLANSLKAHPAQTAADISTTYGIEKNKALEWLEQMKWNDGSNRNLDFISEAVSILKKSGLINPEVPYSVFSYRKEL
jgi:sulfonate transport system substrate-binding protein